MRCIRTTLKVGLHRNSIESVYEQLYGLTAPLVHCLYPLNLLLPKESGAFAE